MAKPAIQSFCRCFSVALAANKFQLRRLTARALELALEARDWPQVAACKSELHAFEMEMAAGLSVRTHLSLADNELPDIFHIAAEGRHGPSPGLLSVKTEDGVTLTAEDEVEAEITRYFSALFQGRHVASPDGPMDSGATFQPDESLFPAFLTGLHTLSADQRLALEQPLTLDELEAAVEGAASSKSPGLDGLSYEFYRATFAEVGPALLAASNAMLAEGLLPASFRQGLVRLIPKVRGVPTASQLRPITLLGTDYKLLTKILVARLLPVLPSVLCSTQLCSIRGRSIFDGPASVLSSVEFLHRHQRPGFLLSLDFFHAYDRVSLPWVDRVMKAMGFGNIFRGWMATLHRGASAAFLLRRISPFMAILFSIRQGDPLAALLFIIYLEPFLVKLEASLRGLQLAHIREAAFGYMDDVEVLGSHLSDITTVDSVTLDFEAASGALLNRNRKTLILGLGSWAGRQDWPLPWLQAATSIKVLGFEIHPTFTASVEATWSRVLAGLRSTVQSWSGRRLPILLQRVQVLEVYVSSRAWYFAQVIPLSATAAASLRSILGDFVWAHSLARLAFPQLHRPFSEGGLGLSCPIKRAQSLLVKQTLHQLAAGGRTALHLTYWMGTALQGRLPLPTGAVLLTGQPPQQFTDLQALLLEAVTLPSVNPAFLEATKSSRLYKDWLTDLPLPRIQLKLPLLPWDLVWKRLAAPLLPPLEVDLHFRALHNLLLTMERRHRFGDAPSSACPHCPALVEDSLHLFTSCPRVAGAWDYLLHRAILVSGMALTNSSLFFLAWPARPARLEAALVLAVVSFSAWAWETRDTQTPLLPPDLKTRVDLAAAGGPHPSIF